MYGTYEQQCYSHYDRQANCKEGNCQDLVVLIITSAALEI